MSVGVQREACRKMPQHARYSLDVHTVLQSQRCEGVAQVMEPHLWQPCPLQDAVQHVQHAVRRHGASDGRGKHPFAVCQQDRTQRLTRRNRGLPDGAAITTLGAFRTFTNIPGPGVRTAYFAALGSWPEALLKDTESLRNSDALMRVAVPQASRPRWAA